VAFKQKESPIGDYRYSNNRTEKRPVKISVKQAGSVYLQQARRRWTRWTITKSPRWNKRGIHKNCRGKREMGRVAFKQDPEGAASLAGCWIFPIWTISPGRFSLFSHFSFHFHLV